MAEYIERDAFIADQRHLYCEHCDRRKGMKNGKLKYVYAIGEAPCRACDIGDMLDAVEDYPAADVVARDCYDRLLAENDELRKERPVRHGRWVDAEGNLVPWDEKNENCPLNSAFCSVCGDWLTASDEYPTIGNYCPNCGAKMDKGGDGDV